MSIHEATDRLTTKAFTWWYHLTNSNKAAILRVKAEGLTYLTARDLLNLYDVAREVEEAQVAGLFIEAGCALGGSAIALGRAKRTERELRLYDAFGMIPPPSGKDDADVHARYEEIKSGKSKGIGGATYYGYTENLQEVVAGNLTKHGLPPQDCNIKLIKGYFEDTLYITGPVALAHIDCDWYASVMSCLLQIEPHLSPGGKLLFDDYYDWSGCRTAVDEYFADKTGYTFNQVGRKLHVTKIAD